MNEIRTFLRGVKVNNYKDCNAQSYTEIKKYLSLSLNPLFPPFNCVANVYTGVIYWLETMSPIYAIPSFEPHFHGDGTKKN